MLDVLAATLAIEPHIENTVGQSLCLANAMTAIAEGVLIRLNCGRRCFEAYRAILW